jgi:hypothetical protein
MIASATFERALLNKTTLGAFREANKKAAHACNHTNNNTSKNNYIDPRIIYTFSNKTNIPISSLLSEQCIKKFHWVVNEIGQTTTFTF